MTIHIPGLDGLQRLLRTWEALNNLEAPSKDIAGGFMSRDQIIQLIRKVATEASLIGYCHAEKLTRERMDKKLTAIEQELTIIKEQLKDTEIELIVATK